MKKNVILCDECKMKVAEYKCRYCGKDLCDYHLMGVSLAFQKWEYSSQEDYNILSIKVLHKSGDGGEAICEACSVKIKKRFTILYNSIVVDGDASLEAELIDNIFKLLEKYAKMEVI